MAGRLQRSTDLLSRFMRRIVVVKLDNGNIIVSGVLLSAEESLHNGIGNLLLKDGCAFILVRGQAVQIIACMHFSYDVFHSSSSGPYHCKNRLET